MWTLGMGGGMARVVTPSVQYVQIEEARLRWEEAVSVGLELRAMKDDSQWGLGDLALKVEKDYGTDAIGKLANEIGINKKSLQQYRRVAAAFPKEKRVLHLSHRHHLILAAREDRFEWLEKAADNNWSTARLLRELKGRNGPAKKDERSPDIFRCPDCGGWRIETDNVCQCYEERRKYAKETRTPGQKG